METAKKCFSLVASETTSPFSIEIVNNLRTKQFCEANVWCSTYGPWLTYGTYWMYCCGTYDTPLPDWSVSLCDTCS